VGLAQAGAAVQQQRVVGAVAGLLRGLPGGGAAELVAAALDEVVEGVMAVEMSLESVDRRRARCRLRSWEALGHCQANRTGSRKEMRQIKVLAMLRASFNE